MRSQGVAVEIATESFPLLPSRTCALSGWLHMVFASVVQCGPLSKSMQPSSLQARDPEGEKGY